MCIMRVCGPQAVPAHGAARGRNAVEELGSDASGRQAGQRQVSPNIQRVEWVSLSFFSYSRLRFLRIHGYHFLFRDESIPKP